VALLYHAGPPYDASPIIGDSRGYQVVRHDDLAPPDRIISW
jgi:hypothetical protein